MAEGKAMMRAFLKTPHNLQARHEMSLVVHPDNPLQRLIVSGREQSTAYLVCSSGSGELVHMGIMLGGRFRVRSASATKYFRFVYIDRTKHGVQLLAADDRSTLLDGACRAVSGFPRMHFCMGAHPTMALSQHLVAAIQADLRRSFSVGFGSGLPMPHSLADAHSSTNCCLFARRLYGVLNPGQRIDILMPSPAACARAAAAQHGRMQDVDEDSDSGSDTDNEAGTESEEDSLASENTAPPGAGLWDEDAEDELYATAGLEHGDDEQDGSDGFDDEEGGDGQGTCDGEDEGDNGYVPARGCVASRHASRRVQPAAAVLNGESEDSASEGDEGTDADESGSEGGSEDEPCGLGVSEAAQRSACGAVRAATGRKHGRMEGRPVVGRRVRPRT